MHSFIKIHFIINSYYLNLYLIINYLVVYQNQQSLTLIHYTL